MDGNGRWAKERGLPRTEGHKVGAERVLDVLQGGIEMGVGAISLYAFSTENWKRSPDEVRFLMNFNRDFIRKTRDQLDELGIRPLGGPYAQAVEVRRQGAPGRPGADQGQRPADAVLLHELRRPRGDRRRRAGARRGREGGPLDPSKVNEKTLQRYMYYPDMPDVDLFLRPSGEQRTSNYLLWQSAYAEMVFQDVLWPDFDRRDLWRACLEFASRDRRFGGAIPNEELLAMEGRQA